MVTIPQRNPNQVAPGPASVPLLGGSVSPDVHGASAFRALSDAADVETRKTDRRTALRASMDAKTAMDELWFSEGRIKEGQDFFDWEETYEARVDEVIKGATEGLSSSQSPLIEQDLNNMRLSFARDVQQRMGPVRKEFHEGGLALDMEDLTESAVKHSSDPTASLETMQSGLDQLALRLDEFATEFPEYIGVDKALWMEDNIKEAESMLVRKGISATTAKGNDKLAAAQLEQFGHLMTTDQQIAAGKDVELSTNLGDIAGNFEFLSAGEPLLVAGNARDLANDSGREYFAPEAQIAEWNRKTREKGEAEGWSQKKIEEAVKYNSARGKEMLRIERAKQADVFDAMLRELSGPNGNLLTLQKNRPTAWHHITTDQQDTLTDVAIDQAEGRLKRNATANFIALSAMRFEDEDKFLEFMAGGTAVAKLEKGDFTKAEKWAKDIREGHRTKGSDTQEEMILEAMRASELERETDEGEKFWNTASDMADREKSVRGLDFLTKTDMDKLLEPLKATAVYDSFGNAIEFEDDGIFFDSDITLGQMTPELLDIDQINPDIVITGKETIRRNVSPRVFGKMTQDELELEVKKLYLGSLFEHASTSDSAEQRDRGERLHATAERLRARDKGESSPLPFQPKSRRINSPNRGQRAKIASNPVRSVRGF